MNQLKEKEQEIEYYISTKKNILVGAKISFILLLLVGFGMEYLQTLGFRAKYKYTWLEWNSLQLILLASLCVPFIFMPLHKFISDRYMNHYVWSVKNTLFESVLKKYTSDFQISLNGCLPDKDITFLGLEKGWVSFVYGDDLIFGTINNVKFRMSEMHSNGLITRHFDGVIAVLIFNQIIDINLAKAKEKKLPEFVEMRITENRIYLLAKGDKKLFEINIKKQQMNAEELIEDQNYFSEFMLVINDISLSL